ncbi:MAG: carbamoyltransferase, partial [Acidimicrobiia bacterium]
RNPFAQLPRKLAFALASRPGRTMRTERAGVVGRVLRLRAELAHNLDVDPATIRAKIHFVEHHKAHLASAMFVSGFDRAAVCSIDGFGDLVSGMWGVGEGARIKVHGRVRFPHSLGVFYEALTQYLGFAKWGDEYKVMGLSSYGEPDYLDEMRRIVANDDELGYRLDLECFRHHLEGSSMTWDGGSPVSRVLYSPELERRLGPARRGPDEEITDRHRAVAASLQRRLEEVVLELLRRLQARAGLDRLCLAGGVALNCVVNGRIRTDTPFRELFIQPAAGDGGTSIGAAFHVWHQVLGRPRSEVMEHAYLGPEFSETEAKEALTAAGVVWKAVPGPELSDLVAGMLAEGRIVGWFQGRMEFGPRALGNRSILADPRRPEMKDVLNARVKHREPFRPFAPSVLEHRTGEWFDQSYPSPFMLLTYGVLPHRRHLIPAPTHVDGTGRLQTVRRDQNPRFFDLLMAFERRTGVPVVLNTSFNDNEPICCAPAEAVDCFRRTHMDVLVIGNLVAEKRWNPPDTPVP